MECPVSASAQKRPPAPRQSLTPFSASAKRLRIAFVADNFQASVSGGVVTAWRFVEKLRARHDVIAVGADVDGPDSVRLKPFTLPVRAMREMNFLMAHPDRKLLTEVFASVDVVHFQFPFWLSLSTIGLAHQLGRPTVAAFHVQPENVLLNVGVRAPWLSRAMYRAWVKHFYGLADAVVVPTAFAAQKLASYGLARPAHVVSNAVPTDLVDARVERRAPDGRFRVLSVGRLAAEKHQELLIEAVRRSRHRDRIDLVIAGMGPREEELRRHAATLPRGADVGFVSREKLVHLLGTSDVFVHCSEVELEGIAVIEAMSMGLPVLVAEGPESAASDFALDGRFRFPVGDVEALTAKLDALLDRPMELQRAGERYRKAARALNLEASVTRLIEVYQSVAKPAAHPREELQVAAE